MEVKGRQNEVREVGAGQDVQIYPKQKYTSHSAVHLPVGFSGKERVFTVSYLKDVDLINEPLL